MIIKNNDLTVKINNFGAEIKSIKKDNVEYIWQGNSKYWKRSSPVLFPIVGKLIDNEYIYENKIFNLSQHGFARDNEFKLVNLSNNDVLYMLEENEETLKRYPFKFKLYIGYKLIDNAIVVSWKVENINNKTMYFQIGGHPAFNFLNGSIIEIDKVTNYYELKGKPYIQNIIKNFGVDSFEVDDNTFQNNALIFDNIDYIELKDNKKSVKIDCLGFPYIGIWSNIIDNKNAPFICLEPWYGIADFKDHDKNFINKIGINKLEPKAVFNAKYQIIIN